MGALVQIPQNRHGKNFVMPRVAEQRYLVFEGSLKCRPGRHPNPPTPDAARIVTYKQRQQLAGNPECVPCSGFLFVAGTVALMQRCNAVFAALLSFRLSMFICSSEDTNRGTISERPELGRRGGRATDSGI